MCPNAASGATWQKIVGSGKAAESEMFKMMAMAMMQMQLRQEPSQLQQEQRIKWHFSFGSAERTLRTIYEIKIGQRMRGSRRD